MSRVLRDGKVIDEEHHTTEMRLYFQYEIRLLLESAGFRDHGLNRADAGDGAWQPVVVARA